MRVIKVADIAPDIEKADVTHWYVKEGEIVAADADIAEFADSKNVFVAKAPVAMRITRIAAPKGTKIAPESVLCEGEDV